jgi:hypothetical protein
MPPWIPRSVFGAILAAIYATFAIVAVTSDRDPSSGGGWISLRGMISFLATFPVSAFGEMMGTKLDYRRNLDMAFAISVCSVLIYFVGAGIGKIVRLIFTNEGAL